MEIQEAVASDIEILGGTLCFQGTRVPVRSLFDYLQGGQTIDEFLSAFDWVNREMVIAVLNHSASLLDPHAMKSNNFESRL